MEYFFENIHFHLLKNYILKDPICDWYNIQEHITPGLYEKDTQTLYQRHILKESGDYKTRFLQKIKDFSELDIPLETCINETKEKIEHNYPLILRPTILDKHNIYTNCDIMIKYSLFKKIFNKISNLPFHLLCENDDYLLIVLTYNTLEFKIDLKDVVNEPLTVYKKCKLYAFRNALHDFCGKQYKSFIIGKEYSYKKTILPKKEFICKPELNEYIHEIFVKSIQWIYFLKNNFQIMNIIPKPTHDELYPNMNYKETSWEKEKTILAENIKETTLVWNISYEERCELLKKDIYCWDDPRLLGLLKESKKKNIQERMIHMNQQNEILLYPRKTISYDFKKLLERSENDIYFDVESFLSFDERQNLFTDYIPEKKPILAILGIIHNTNFYDFTIHDYSLNSEKKIVKNFIKYLWFMKRKCKNKIKIYHWGNAEFNYMKYINKTYNISIPEYELINVLDYFRMEPIIVQGIFKFGLKSVGKALYNHNLIKTTWSDNDSGLDSMIKFKEICEKNNKNIPLKRFIEIDEIIEYNRIDCQVLFEIVEVLRNKYG